MFIDSHCHLDWDEFADDRETVLARAQKLGVEKFLTISIRVREFDRVLRVAEQFDQVFCAVGTHPHFAHEEPDVTTEELVALSRHRKVVAIGESGLDSFLCKTPLEDQRRAFANHIAAARQAQLPLVIHSVRVDEEMSETLVSETRKGAFPIIMHCFSGGTKLAETCLSLGAYISFSGILCWEEEDELRSLAATIPDDRILLETDAPSLSPIPKIQSRNEPALITHVAETLARVRGQNVNAVAALTSENFRRVCRKAFS
ncbi:TatD DNase family protein [Rhizobium sp. BK313]|uniref:TatD family hydrolase n=1 Tax=Rhizobium sp. BK313 TaxID=2587081 RepID=UPI00105BC569|nr:TatD family hydrolase [Rhizobium sp. BK313]MBB3458307.1 TatD DNase family protein [Rhizobium sp. BK313]